MIFHPLQTHKKIIKKIKINVSLSALERDKGEGEAASSAYAQNFATKSQGRSGGLIGGFSFHSENLFFVVVILHFRHDYFHWNLQVCEHLPTSNVETLRHQVTNCWLISQLCIRLRPQCGPRPATRRRLGLIAFT